MKKIILIFCVTAAMEFEIACKYSCKADGDDTYLVKDGICYCANRKDINKIVLKIPQKGYND